MKLDIGSGENRHAEDFTTVDLYNPKADIRAPMWDIPLPSDSVDEIWCESALEHVSRSNVGKSLKEWHRLLKPHGAATIIVPNFDYIAKYWLDEKSDRIWAHMLVFGTQGGPGQFHKTAFTPTTFNMDLIIAGFQVFEIVAIGTHNQEMMRARCTKLPVILVQPEGDEYIMEFSGEK